MSGDIDEEILDIEVTTSDARKRFVVWKHFIAENRPTEHPKRFLNVARNFYPMQANQGPLI